MGSKIKKALGKVKKWPVWGILAFIGAAIVAFVIGSLAIVSGERIPNEIVRERKTTAAARQRIAGRDVNRIRDKYGKRI